MRSDFIRGRRSFALLMLCAAAGCGAGEVDAASERHETPPGGPAHSAAGVITEADLDASVRRELQRVRDVTSHLASFDRAMGDGWSLRVTECMESDAGGQGIHYGNPALISDGAALDPLRPELLMYEPQADGTKRYVGIEYIVPVEDWRDSTPPRLFERDFHLDERYGTWVLHVWWVPNARGLFANWNPDVSCAAVR